jgi:hypothetical protein
VFPRSTVSFVLSTAALMRDGTLLDCPETRAGRKGMRARNNTAKPAKKYRGRMFIISLI